VERSRYQDRLEKRFGPMEPSLRNVAPTPNDLSPELTAMCRSLATTSKMEMLYLVDYFVAEWHGANPYEFACFLYETNHDSQRWEYMDTLFIRPDIKPRGWSMVTVSGYLQSFAEVPGERWYLDKLTRPAFYGDYSEVGTRMRNLRYYETPRCPGFVERGGRSWDLNHLTDAELPIAIRRLLAKRLGREAKLLILDPSALITVDNLVTAANIDRSTMSADALQALEAIVVEMDGVGGNIDKADRCVGEGPDDLYR
jgi:hypothetical protein